MVSRVSRSLSVKISRTVAMALGAVALSSQTRRKTLISVSEKPMSCSFWIHSMRLTSVAPVHAKAALGPHRRVEQAQLFIEVYGPNRLSGSTRYITHFE